MCGMPPGHFGFLGLLGNSILIGGDAEEDRLWGTLP